MNNDDIFNDDARYEDSYDDIVSKKTISMAEMRISENFEHYSELLTLMRNKQPLTLAMGIEEGLPYYQTELHGKQVKIFLTKEIYQQILNYLKNSIIPDKMPEVFEVYKNINENFILRSFKADNANRVTTYSPQTKEYKAKYPNGIINYGQLPYTTDELKAKLISLQ
jgi:hypothetical protein